MRQRRLIGQCPKRWVATTISDPDVVAVDLLKRRFGPGTVELDRVYVGDFTYIRTWEGWLYLATSSTSHHDVSSGGRWLSTCAPSWSATRSAWQSMLAGPRRVATTP